MRSMQAAGIQRCLIRSGAVNGGQERLVRARRGGQYQLIHRRKALVSECGTKGRLTNHNKPRGDSIVTGSLVSLLDLMIQGNSDVSSAFSLLKKGVGIELGTLSSITLNSTIQVALSIFH